MAAGDKLRYRPAQTLSTEDLEALRRYKSEVLARLQALQAEAVAALPTEGRELLTRLRKGAEWLLDHHRLWQDESPGAAGDALFGKMLHLWADLNEQLRAEYAFKGCVRGPGQRCPDDAPVVCMACIIN
jgi:hypothetical protein